MIDSDLKDRYRALQTAPQDAADDNAAVDDGKDHDEHPGGGERPLPREIGGRDGPDPTRYGDWEKNGRCIDF